MERKYILMICLMLGLLINNSCSEEKGDPFPIENTMFINYSSYNLIFNYGINEENSMKLNKNDSLRRTDTLKSLVDWFSSGNHNKIIYGDSSITVFDYSIYIDSTTIENGKYYYTCKFTDSLLNDIKISMATKGYFPKKIKN